jgi:hypothetical protein
MRRRRCSVGVADETRQQSDGSTSTQQGSSGVSRDDWPRDEIPIPAVLLPPKGGPQAPRVRARNTNWKGVVGIIIAVVIAPNLLVMASSLPERAPFAVVLTVALVLPLVAVLAGFLMSRDIRKGASSSRALAVAAIGVGLGMAFLMIAFLLVLSAITG